jgi:hypothetical protein
MSQDKFRGQVSEKAQGLIDDCCNDLFSLISEGKYPQGVVMVSCIQVAAELHYSAMKEAPDDEGAKEKFIATVRKATFGDD